MHVGLAPPGTGIVSTIFHVNGQGRTNRDRNASILQCFADDVSASTRDVGVLQMKLELLREGSRERHGSLASRISSVVHRALMRQSGDCGSIRKRTTSSPLPVSSPARTFANESSPPLPSVALCISVAKKHTVDRTRGSNAA